MRTDKIRKYLIPNIPYLFILWAFLKLGTAYRLAAGNDFAHMLIRKIYEDNVIGRLSDRLFQSMLTDYENEQNELNKIIETDTADMQRIIGGQNKASISKIPKRKMNCLPLLKMWNSFFIVSGIVNL